jgi:hypothetical protein
MPVTADEAFEKWAAGPDEASQRETFHGGWDARQAEVEELRGRLSKTVPCCDEQAQLRAEVVKLEVALRSVEWKSVGLTKLCEACSRFIEYGHTADCIVGQALAPDGKELT